MELGFDVPWEVRSAVLVENFVGAYGIFVFGIDQKTVHVEEACLDGRQSDDLWISCCERGCHAMMLSEEAETYCFCGAMVKIKVGW